MTRRSGHDPRPHDDTAADRGFVAALSPARVTHEDGEVVWDSDAYAFLDTPDCPDTVHPGLWRQSRLCAKQGLYEVTGGVYQVRNLDLSNMTLIEGTDGVVVVDPLISAETAAAALALYRAHRGERPVTGVIYTHSHSDHCGGAGGVLPDGAGDVPVIAPRGFVEHLVSENVYAGTAMSRRASYMYGILLEKSPTGQVGCGLGMAVSKGTITFIPPTRDVTRTGQEEVIDGVRFVFQLTPDTEAPAEMNFLLPERRALCMAENATHTMHNVLTLRGAEIRDARRWARYLDEALNLFAPEADVVFASHHWPTWGVDAIAEFLTAQRDLYAYLHDQTLRLTNKGLTGTEIAEQVRLPPSLEAVPSVRGYYGSVSHNVKAIYQRYMGWYDGNPAHLWEHPPVDLARRYVADYGGSAAVTARAREYAAQGDLRFAATLLNHAVFAEPDSAEAREALASVYERLGRGAENATWRNIYLTGALELRHRPPPVTLHSRMGTALTVDQILDTMAVRIDGPRAWDEHLVLDLRVTDEQQTWRLTLSHGALTHRSTPPGQRPAGDAPATLTLTRLQLLALANGEQEDIATQGDPGVLPRLLGLLDTPDLHFDIVTP
ncbi:alkyl sulfatase dimerization domain-containing protein [Streptomyces sp. NPDC049910]|uniref:alkyl/aryl-sulfatase n=1 Tax=Streptomyces sp. NPDC049910 TaxID=3155278 RepID=UPI003422874F